MQAKLQRRQTLSDARRALVLDAARAVSYATPFLFRDSLAMHVLTSIPLSSAHGKKTVAKEMMLWEGDDGYYAVGGGRRYVMLDGSLAPPTGADDFRVLAARVRELRAHIAAQGPGRR